MSTSYGPCWYDSRMWSPLIYSYVFIPVNLYLYCSSESHSLLSSHNPRRMPHLVNFSSDSPMFSSAPLSISSPRTTSTTLPAGSRKHSPKLHIKLHLQLRKRLIDPQKPLFQLHRRLRLLPSHHHPRRRHNHLPQYPYPLPIPNSLPPSSCLCRMICWGEK